MRLAAIAAGLLLAPLLNSQTPYLRVDPDIQAQRLIFSVRPEYPRLARAARIEGTVVLAALIDENGRVERLKLVSGHPFLVKAAFDAVKQWRYRPAIRYGRPAAVLTSISLTFRLGADSGGRGPGVRV